jgi:NitT/TauT family transport system substrate-binding protein
MTQAGFPSRSNFLTSLAAATLTLPSPSSAQELTKIAMTVVPNDDVSPILWAQQTGLFRKAGLDVTLQQNRSGAAIAAAVAGGSFQAGLASMMALIAGHARGVPFVMIAPSLLYQTADPAALLVVLKDSPYHSLRDLAGKTVAVSAIKDVNWVGTRGYLDQAGVDSSSVQFVEIAQTEIPAALEQKRIDAATLLNPNLEEAMQTGKFRSIGKPHDGIAKRWMVAAWFTTTDYAAKNRDAIRRFAGVVHTATVFSNTHHAETAPLIAQFTGIELAHAQVMKRVTCDEYLDPHDIQPAIDAAVKYGVIDHGFAAAEMISPDALKPGRA